MKSLFNLATGAKSKNGANLNKNSGLPIYPRNEPVKGTNKKNSTGTKSKLTNSKSKKVNTNVNGATNCVPYKPTEEQIAKRKKKDCFELLQQFDYTPLTISLNKLKSNIFEIDKKLNASKGSKKKKKNPNRCDSEDVSFIKVNKMFVYSINVLESAIKKMKKIVILPDENNCPETVGEPVGNANNVSKFPVANARIAGGSATNDVCTDYNELIVNIRDILANIDIMLSSKNYIINEKKCMMVSDIFEKLQISKSKFEEVIEKLNKDKRLSRTLSNGRNVAPINGGRNQTVKKRSV